MFEYLFYYISWERIWAKFNQEIPGMGILALIILLEILLSGWKNSSLFVLHKTSAADRKSGIWELFSFLIFIFNIRKILSNFLFLGAIALLYEKLGAFSWGLLQSWPILVRTALLVIAYDFLFYWSHRWRHNSAWLWNVHEFHHSSTWVNSLTRYRAHPLDLPVILLTIYVPLQLLFGPDLLQWTVAFFAISFFGYFNHSRIDIGLGWVGRYILSGPRYHHVHHALPEANESFCNFGEIFIFWDRIFKTYRPPARSIENIQAGLPRNEYVGSQPLHAFLKPVIRFYRAPIDAGVLFFKGHIKSKTAASNAEP